MLGKKAPCNGRSLDLNNPFDFQPIMYSVLLWYKILVDKQTYFGNYHHQKKYYHKNNLNQMLEVSLFYLALILILLLLLIFQVLCLIRNFLQD